MSESVARVDSFFPIGQEWICVLSMWFGIDNINTLVAGEQVDDQQHPYHYAANKGLELARDTCGECQTRGRSPLHTPVGLYHVQG